MTENNSENTAIQETSSNTTQMVLVLVGGGALGSLYLLLKKSRNILSWILPVGMIAAGTSLFVSERQKMIRQTGDQIMAQLDGLDPIAKAEVVEYLATKELRRRKK